MITCSEAVEQLWHYLEHELSDDRRAEIEEHLAFCRRCCGELEFAEELRRFLADAARPKLPPEVEGRLDSFLRDLDGDTTRDLEGDTAPGGPDPR
jgi:anti-sigma factor (TIGR02949 family)